MSDLLKLHHGARPLGDGTTRFNLWSPLEPSVRLVLEQLETTIEMAPVGDGWLTATAPAGHGDRYHYRMADGRALPDPAARRLPDGVHGAAAVVDPSRWATQTFNAGPVTGAVIYELHIGTFSDEGTFDAAIAHLGDLAELGVTHVEVMPVNAFDGEYGWGYDGVAWHAVYEPYGGPDGFARFVEACHQVNLAVIVDAVYNHLGPSGNYLPAFGPYLQETAESTWGKVINLDRANSGPVRSFIIESALGWFQDYGVDGLRLDAVHAFDDRRSARPFLAELSDAVAELSEQTGRRYELIAETDRNDPQTIRPRVVGGLGTDAQWADDLHHCLHVGVTGEVDGYYVDYSDPLDLLAETLVHGLTYRGQRHSVFRDRVVGASLPPDVSLRQLVSCIQNHDQVGNRPVGDRLTTMVAPELLKVAIGLVCCAPHTPMLFMGEEYGETSPFAFFCDMPGEELRSAIRQGRKAEFDYFTSWDGEVLDPTDRATFEASRLDRSLSETDEGRQRRRLWADLLKLRRNVAALATGRQELVSARRLEGFDVVVMHRLPPSWATGAEAVAVAANFGASEVDYEIDGEVLLATGDRAYGGPFTASDLTGETLPANTLIVHTTGQPTR